MVSNSITATGVHPHASLHLPTLFTQPKSSAERNVGEIVAVPIRCRDATAALRTSNGKVGKPPAIVVGIGGETLHRFVESFGVSMNFYTDLDEAVFSFEVELPISGGEPGKPSHIRVIVELPMLLQSMVE